MEKPQFSNQKQIDNLPELGEFPAKIKVQYIRWLLGYLGVQYREFLPQTAKDWYRKRDKLYKLNPLVALPYYKDGDLVISGLDTICSAICMRAGRKDMLGGSSQELIWVKTIQNILDEIRDFVWRVAIQNQIYFDNQYIQDIIVDLDDNLHKLSKVLGSKQFLLKKITVVDFEISHYVNFFFWISRTFNTKNPAEKYPNLVDLLRTIKSLPGVSEYIKSNLEKETPWMLNKT